MTHIKFLLMMVIVCVISACGEDDKGDTTDKPAQLVKSMVIGENKSKDNRKFTGHVIASKKVDLSFEVAGKIIKLNVAEGQAVEKGYEIAKLDSRDYLSTFNAKRAERSKNEKTYLRYKKLFKTGAIPEAHVDKAKAQFEKSKSAQEMSQKALDNTRLLAPFSGLIAKIYVDNYQYIKANQKIISLQDISTIDLIFSIPEQAIVKIQSLTVIDNMRGKEVPGVVVFDAVPSKEFVVTLKELSTEADSITKSFQITVSMSAPKDINILPGMAASLEMRSHDNNPQLYLVPIHAVATDEAGKSYVWLIDPKTHTAHKQHVKVGVIVKDNVQILVGLKRGDRIVTAGLSKMYEGMKVRFSMTEGELR